MHRTLIPISLMFSLGVVVSLLYSAGGWAQGTGTAPGGRGIGPAGGLWSPWHHGGQRVPAAKRAKSRDVRHGQTRRGYLVVPGRVFGPPMPYGGAPSAYPGFSPPPRFWSGYGPGPSVAPGYPGRSRPRPHRLTPRQPARDVWAPDESADVYRGFTSPPAAVAGGELGTEASVASDVEAVTPVEEPVAETPLPIPPVSEAAADVVREPSGSQAAPPVEMEISVEPPALEPQAEMRPVPLPPAQPMPESVESTAGQPEPPPSGVAAAPAQPQPLPPPPAAPVAAIEPEVKTAAGAVAEETKALAEEAPVTADSGVTETPAADVSAQDHTAETGQGAEAAEGQQRSLVERWLTPRPGGR